MPIGIVEDKDFESELNSYERSSVQIQVGEILELPTPGRAPGDNNIPESLRKIIGENALESGSADTKSLTRAFGISDSSLSAYKNGSTSTTSYNSPKSELKNHINKTKQRISIKAKNRLVSALNQITDEKLADAKVRDLAGVAKDMSAIIKDMEPDVDKNNSNPSGPVFMVYAPQFKSEDSFDVIHVKE